MRGLEGVRVLELGEGVSAAWAAKLMGDLGADVIKVEPPGGDRARWHGPFRGGAPDPEQSGRFLYLNPSKRGIEHDVPAPTAAPSSSDWSSAPTSWCTTTPRPACASWAWSTTSWRRSGPSS